MPQLHPNTKAKLTNQSLVFEVYGDDEKLTISEVTQRLNGLSERTVRRAIEDLVSGGLLRPFGKRPGTNALIFGKPSASFAEPEKAELVPFGGQMITVQDFIELMTDPELRPLKRKTALLSERRQHAIRRMLAYVVISAGQTGQQEQLKSVSANLHSVVEELEFISQTLRHFVDSPLWYEQYRDRVGLSVRKLQEQYPEMYQLATDYIRSES